MLKQEPDSSCGGRIEGEGAALTAGPDRRPAPDASGRVRALAREPFIQFLVLGLLIFVANSYLAKESDHEYEVVIDAKELRRIEANYELQFGSRPTRGELEHIVDREIEEEILYREGLAMGLDQGDEIVRRRVAQKFQFVQQDLILVSEPAEASLRTYYQAHADKYTSPMRVSFSHRYFSPDRSDEEDARVRAVDAVKMLGASLEPGPRFGDPFAGQFDYWSVDAAAVSRLFGDSQLSSGVFKVPLKRWSDPLRSGYGWHTVYVHENEPARRLSFDQVRERVREDYRERVREQSRAAALEKLMQKYTIVRAELDDE